MGKRSGLPHRWSESPNIPWEGPLPRPRETPFCMRSSIFRPCRARASEARSRGNPRSSAAGNSSNPGIRADLRIGSSARISGPHCYGASIVFVSYDGRLCGVFVISDTVRKEAAEAVGMLKKAGIGVSLVTGDNTGTAAAVAAATGIGSVKARVSPVGKAEDIERLEKEGRRVLMAGDGVNDA